MILEFVGLRMEINLIPGDIYNDKTSGAGGCKTPDRCPV